MTKLKRSAKDPDMHQNTDREIVEVVQAHLARKAIKMANLMEPQHVWEPCQGRPAWNFDEFRYEVDPDRS